jgi:hypothetical protein
MCLQFESMFSINAVPGVVELLYSLKYVMVKLILLQVKTFFNSCSYYAT